MKAKSKRVKSSQITDPKRILAIKAEISKLLAMKLPEEAPLLTKKDDELMMSYRKRKNTYKAGLRSA